MKRKKVIAVIAVVFLLAIFALTYFSKTIDNMLLPQVKTCEAVLGDIEGEDVHSITFLVPKSTVIFSGDTASVFIVTGEDEDKTVVKEDVSIQDSDEIYYVISGGSAVTNTAQLVYSTSKPLHDGDRVYVAEAV